MEEMFPQSLLHQLSSFNKAAEFLFRDIVDSAFFRLRAFGFLILDGKALPDNYAEVTAVFFPKLVLGELDHVGRVSGSADGRDHFSHLSGSLANIRSSQQMRHDDTTPRAG